MQSIIFVILTMFSLSGFAKFCPSCFETFQSSTTRGKATLFYQWMIRNMGAKQALELEEFPHIFSQSVVVSVNGVTVATNIQQVSKYFYKIRQTKPVEDARLMEQVVNSESAAIKYQTIFKTKGKRYRNIVISILIFQKNKLIKWDSVSHVIPAG